MSEPDPTPLTEDPRAGDRTGIAPPAEDTSTGQLGFGFQVDTAPGPRRKRRRPTPRSTPPAGDLAAPVMSLFGDDFTPRAERTRDTSLRDDNPAPPDGTPEPTSTGSDGEGGAAAEPEQPAGKRKNRRQKAKGSAAAGDVEVVSPETVAHFDARPTLFDHVVNIDVHLHSPAEAVANISGADPERSLATLTKLVPGLRIIRNRRVAFPTSMLDRLLCFRRPAQVTLDAAAACVAKALWAHQLGFSPLVVERRGRRIVARSNRWPTGWRIVDAPWTAVAALDALGIPYVVSEGSERSVRRKLASAGRTVAVASLAGTSLSIDASNPQLLESLGIPALTHAGAPGSGRYRLPLLAAEPLLDEPSVTLTPEAAAAVRHANRRIVPRDAPEGFPWTLYGFQRRDLATAQRIVETTGGVLLAGTMGTGKALEASTPVHTPAGPVPIGELSVGDEVLGSDGAPHPVTGVFPQGVRNLFKVHLCDGTSLRCDAEHLWSVHRNGADREVLSTVELASALAAGEELTLPTAAPLRFESRRPPRPFLIGARRGRSRSGRIPGEYLYADAAARLATLQGVLSLAGEVHPEDTSVVQVDLTDAGLAGDVAWLVRSLGGYATVSERRAGGATVEIVAAGLELFRGGSKAAAHTPPAVTPPRRIAEIAAAGAGEAVCISVASPDECFVAGDAVVTHNTTVALALAEALDCWPMLVVAPLAAFSTWLRQLEEMGRSAYLATEPVPVASETILTGSHDAVIISYDRLHQFLDVIDQCSFASCFADEVQRIRTPGSRRSRALRSLAAHIGVRVGMSGTPVTNRAEDVLPLGAFLAPGEWRPRLSYADLEELYPGGDPVESLAEHLGTMMVRRRMEDTGVKLPGRHPRRVFVPLTADQRRALEELEEEARAAQEEGELDERMHVFARLTRMRQIVNVPSAAGIPGPNPKVTAAIDLAEEYSSVGRKSVIFVADRAAYSEAAADLESRGLGWVGIWGSTPVPERLEAERRFHADDDVRVFIGTLAACSEALTLSPTATVTIFAALSYSPSAVAQAAARAYRMNTTSEVDEMYLHATAPGGTLDDRIWEILEIKRALAAQVVDRIEHTDATATVSLEDLQYMVTGRRNNSAQLRADAAADADAERERRRRHARGTLYARKTGEVLDDGSHATTLEEHRAAHGGATGDLFDGDPAEFDDETLDPELDTLDDSDESFDVEAGDDT